MVVLTGMGEIIMTLKRGYMVNLWCDGS